MADLKNSTNVTSEQYIRPSSKFSSTPSGGHIDVLSAQMYFKNRGSSDHRRFCEMVGITEMKLDDLEKDMSKWWYGKLRTQEDDPDKPSGLYPRVVAGYRWHMFQYWFTATLSNTLLWLQICFGAAIAALGGANVGTGYRSISVIITIFGALQTVLAGILTYFKARNQPNRARQSLNGLRKIKEEIENAECVFRSDTYQYKVRTVDATGAASTVVLTVDDVVRRLMARYEAVLQDTEINYPDVWHEAERTGAAGSMLVERRIPATETSLGKSRMERKVIKENTKITPVTAPQEADSDSRASTASIRTVDATAE